MAGFAHILRQQRLACGLTQEELAEHARLSVRAISDLERGINHAPRLSTVRLLVRALGLEPADAAVLLEAARSEPVETDASQPVAFDVRYAKRMDGACTAYATLGRGPVLLIPPGFISHLEWWGSAPGVSAFLRPLARHRSAVLYDRHGCGLSDRDRTEFTAEDDMQDIEAVARAVGSSGVDLLGVSWGAAPAILYTAAHPQQVRRLVLYGADCGLPGVAPSTQHIDRRSAMAALRRADLDLYCRAWATKAFPSGIDPAIFRSFVRIFRMAATVEMQEHLEAMSFDIQAALAQIRTPTLVLHRRDDQLARFEAGQHYARRISGARFVPLEGEAHHPWIGDCQSVVNPVLEFICQQDRTRTGAA